MPSGSIYTFTGVTNPSNNTTQIETSQGFVALGTYGYFLPAEVQAATADGLILQAGIVGTAAAAAAHAGPAITGSDGTVGGPGGSPLTGSVVFASSSGGIDAWATTTFYPVNKLVTNGGSTYICAVAHTSGGSFSSVGTNWALVGGGGGGGSTATINHGSTAATVRPTNTGPVVWVGSVTPTNALDGDIWIDNS